MLNNTRRWWEQGDGPTGNPTGASQSATKHRTTKCLWCAALSRSAQRQFRRGAFVRSRGTPVIAGLAPRRPHGAGSFRNVYNWNDRETSSETARHKAFRCFLVVSFRSGPIKSLPRSLMRLLSPLKVLAGPVPATTPLSTRSRSIPE